MTWAQGDYGSRVFLGVVRGSIYPYSERKYFFLCLHVDMSSVLEFRVVDLFAVIMKNFSQRHKLHRFDLGEYGWACLLTFQVRVYGVPSSFNLQMYLLSSVWLLLALWLKLALCEVYLVLKEVAVSPM